MTIGISAAHAQGADTIYTPTDSGYIACHNGNNLYTRALYGSPTLWRLETSDRPIFGAYHKNDNRNIHFLITVKGKTTRLDEAAECTALYKGGERIYHLSDPQWGKGTITMTAIASPDEESAIWKITANKMPKGSKITAVSCKIVNVKISRSADMGVDPKNCFAPSDENEGREECTVTLSNNSIVDIGGKGITQYIKYKDRHLESLHQLHLAQEFESIQEKRQHLLSKLQINTPDHYINTLAPTLIAAGDGIWDGTTYQHGAIGWRMPLAGWRGAYTGDFLGWHDRARNHFDAYAASQVTDKEPIYPHPTQDKEKAMARAEKRWGTQMYSNGYICRNPQRNDQMHHYDMNLCYIDELLWHLKWTGDIEYANLMWHIIQQSLAWEKRNYDPDDDGLYDAYCCIWASDALYYNSGAVTHSSAYNYRSNKIAAEIASLIGEDPTPYTAEAEKILNAINNTLWIEDKGVWAEYKDRMGNKLLHDHPALWTIYHSIDSNIATKEQAYRATGYINVNTPHLKIDSPTQEDYYTVSTTDWMPYAWSINNVAFAEIYHTVLAYWQSGRRDEAFKLLKAAMIDGMYTGGSPGNIGQISQYDAARGECYRDFADPIGVLSRAVVQGLFGYNPDALHRKARINPGWPSEWQYATIKHEDFSIDFNREESTDTYILASTNENIDTITLDLYALREKIKSIKANGSPIEYQIDYESVGAPHISLSVPANETQKIEILWDGSLIAKPQKTKSVDSKPLRLMSQGDMKWWSETENTSKANTYPPVETLGLDLVTGATYQSIDLSKAYNASVTDIFRNEYLSPRSPYTTLQIPVQGIGEWCHPNDTAHIDDTYLRNTQGKILSPEGIPFATKPSGNNIAYTSLFDNYPDSVTIPLTGNGKAINLLLAGSTNHMQCHVENAVIEVSYTDGSDETLRLIAPYNWCPIEQDYYIDGKAFAVPTKRPYRLALKDGTFTRDLETALGITGVYGRSIDGGAAIALSIKLNPDKQLKDLKLKTLANDIVAGLISATLVK